MNTRGLAKRVQRAADERRRWTWGETPRRARVLSPDVPPAELAELGTIRVIEYEEAKGKATADTWRHEHEPRLPVLCTTIGRAPAGAPRRAPHAREQLEDGAALYRLGRLVAFELETPEGNYVRMDVRSRGVVLCGDPKADRMHVLRTTPDAQKRMPPLWIVGGGYRLTERGIVG